MTNNASLPHPSDMFLLHGRVAMVTGASSGLGRHFSEVLAASGASVVVAARRKDRLSELVAHLHELGTQAHAVELDVTDANSVRACFDEIDRLTGAPDIVVSNAGVTVAKPLLEQTEADWDAVLDTNLKGCWMVGTEAARRMVAQGKKGSIINIASILGERVAGAVIGYTVSKAGVIQATKAMALELARHGVRVNALLPGYVMTDLNSDFLKSEAGERLRSRVPARRFSELGDLDGPLLLLASEAGRALTGATVEVDWGHLVSSL